MKALTVKDLLENMKHLVKEGKGDYIVFVTDDEEGNGYHACWYQGVAADTVSKSNLESFSELNGDLSLIKEDTKKAVYLG